ncbi:integrase catalytic domain-containing protein [Trichonephila inaurata madagascariensis]|uniref:Integrase catalytic domain-containing protein n=1 Tax=Trichonephila inaurata madagascariensis TaxID=2747483 RepID=A0A8X6YPN2_9ARAC|nr:integrase catalytic domain-containing protein [Trichonephila inaurata madagascariensis]
MAFCNLVWGWPTSVFCFWVYRIFVGGDSMVACGAKNHGDWPRPIGKKNGGPFSIPGVLKTCFQGKFLNPPGLSRGQNSHFFFRLFGGRGPSWPPWETPRELAHRPSGKTPEVEREKKGPLTYLSENSDDLVPLCPAMFLLENRNLDVPDIDYRDSNKNKKSPLSELQLGEIILIGDDIKKGIHWHLAKVIRLIPGKNGKIRTVDSNWNHATTHSKRLSFGSAVDRNLR